MNGYIAAVAILSLSTVAMADLEMSARLKGVAPSETLDWSSAGGLELQARIWGEERVAFAATLGFETWDAVEEWVDEIDGDDEYRSYVGGRASIMPIGLSMVYRNETEDHIMREAGISFLIEAAIRYAVVNSDVYSEVTAIVDGQSTLFADTIDIDSAWLASLGGAVEFRLDDQLALEFGLSYQVNLTDPEERWLGESIGNTSLNGLGYHMGISMRF